MFCILIVLVVTFVKTHQAVNFKWEHFVTSKLYLDKVVFKKLASSSCFSVYLWHTAPYARLKQSSWRWFISFLTLPRFSMKLLYVCMYVYAYYIYAYIYTHGYIYFIEIKTHIYITHTFKFYSLVVFSVFPELWKHHYYQFYFHNLKKKLHTHLHFICLPTSLSPNCISRTVTNIPSFCICIGLPILETSYKLNHTICDFSDWLVSLRILFFKVHLYCSISQ